MIEKNSKQMHAFLKLTDFNRNTSKGFNGFDKIVLDLMSYFDKASVCIILQLTYFEKNTIQQLNAFWMP